jgi:hypothetical protein
MGRICTENTAFEMISWAYMKMEVAADQFEKLGIRTVKVRTG